MFEEDVHPIAGPPAPPALPGSPAPPARAHSRFRGLALTAAVAMAAGAGTTWAATGGASGSSAALTTAQIAAKTDPGVVDVISTLGYAGGTAAGTGIVLRSSGEVLTNNHVINGATSIKVRDVGNGRTYLARVVGYDASRDIAVLRLSGASGLATADIGDSATVRAGNDVVAIGNAGGQDGTPSVAIGSVTALDQSITASDASSHTSEQLSGLIRTNAPIQPGDSGGPLTSTRGQVIGIDTAASSGFQLSSTATEAFAIPINTAMNIARQIEAGTSSATVHVGATAFLGVEVASPASPFGGTTAGAQVAGVTQGAPAAAAGLSAGDTITALGGHHIASPNNIRSVLTGYHPGDKISITWTGQSGQSHTATITLATGPAA
ncbi:MAG TPA: trypsin-like peptidase domain-containing protein [Streptosporangiaceae bacterium]|nr:trypsin-like peptidase domain-containing protein [Streptosporangiaceae bacterium]